MPVEVTCPTCGAKLKAPDAAIGKRAKCGKCRNPVLVTPPATASSIPPPSPGEPEPFPTLSESENPFDFGTPSPSSPSRPSASASTPSVSARSTPAASMPPPLDAASAFAFASEQEPSLSPASLTRSKPSRYSQRDAKPAAASEKSPAEPNASRYRSVRNQPTSNRLLYISLAGAVVALILGVVSVYIFLDSRRRAAEAQQSKKTRQTQQAATPLLLSTNRPYPRKKRMRRRLNHCPASYLPIISANRLALLLPRKTTRPRINPRNPTRTMGRPPPAPVARLRPNFPSHPWLPIKTPDRLPKRPC
jgi:hypothetical protein